MIVGVPREIKNRENRVGITENGVRELVSSGHEVLVEKGAGVGSFISDDLFEVSGARIIDTNRELYENAEMIMKVKEPLKEEYELLQEGQILFAYLHLAAEAALTAVLRRKHVKAIAYEMIRGVEGDLPLLTPMSEVAGKMATQVGALYLQSDHGGKGVLLGGAHGVEPGLVSIVGGGIVGLNAAKIAVGLGANVRILDVSEKRLEFLNHYFSGKVDALYSNSENIEKAALESDLLVGAVLLPGRRAPTLVSEKMVRSMSKGSVVVDVAVDQGGCIETTRPTSHEDPTFELGGVLHYCVPNIPGIVSRTSTYALANASIGYAQQISDLGLEGAVAESEELLSGLSVYGGEVCCQPVAEDLKLPFKGYLG